MLVYRMVRKVKDSKVLRKIRMRDRGSVVENYHGFDLYQENNGEIAVFMNGSPVLTAKSIKEAHTEIDKYRDQRRSDFQSNVKKMGDAKQNIKSSVSPDLLKRLMKRPTDADPRGYKVSDQIIKGFMIYKSGKGPAMFYAKNENGKEFEGTMEQIKKQIDDYWVKQDENVMKQKVRDGSADDLFAEDVKIIQGEYAGKKGVVLGVGTYGNGKQCLSIRLKNGQVVRGIPVHYVTKDSYSGKSHCYRIKDDKLFRLRSGLKRKMKDGASNYTFLQSMAEKFLGRRLTIKEMAQAETTNLTDYDSAKKYFEEMKGNSKDTYTKGSADRKTKAGKSKDAWTPEARQKALEARRAHMKGKQEASKSQGSVGKEENKHISPHAAEEKMVDPKNIRPKSILRDWYKLSTLKKKFIQVVQPHIDETGELVPGKTETTTASIYYGELKSGKNKGKKYAYLSSEGRRSMAGFIGDDNWNGITKSMNEEDLYKIGLKTQEW